MDERLSPELIELVSQAVVTHIDQQRAELSPVFYAISGSYLHGTAGPDSDIDIQGFHCAPGVEYMLLDPPEPQLRFSKSIQGVPQEIDVVSHELRKFGSQIVGGDFTVSETLFTNLKVYNEVPNLTSDLRATVSEHIALKLPQRYTGMASSLHKRAKQNTPDRVNNPSDIPAKQYLYALRGILAAEYIQGHRHVEPRLTELIQALMDEQFQEQAIQLIKLRRGEVTEVSTTDLIDTLNEYLETALNQLELPETDQQEHDEFRTAVEDWMLEVRDATRTR